MELERGMRGVKIMNSWQYEHLKSVLRILTVFMGSLMSYKQNRSGVRREFVFIVIGVGGSI